MKTKIQLSVIFLLLVFLTDLSRTQVSAANSTTQPQNVKIACTPDLYDLTTKWASEFKVKNPTTKIEVVNTPFNNGILGTTENLSFISNTSPDAIANATNWKMAIGRDIIVPVMNTENPDREEIVKHGISPQQFSDLFNRSEKQNWNLLFPNAKTNLITIYLVNDESVKASVSKFIQSTLLPANYRLVGTTEELILALKKDVFAIGFCKAANILKADNQTTVDNIKILPIDKNGNGTVEQVENIYSDINVFLRGVWIGKYPKTLYSTIYATSKVQPVNETELAFLSWVLEDGQKNMNSFGYCELAGSESQSQLDKLMPVVINLTPEKDSSHAGLLLFVLAGIILAGIIIRLIVRSYSKQQIGIPDFNDQPFGFDEESVVLPDGLYFDKSHTWAFMEKDGNITLGIDDFLQHITGPITRIEMKKTGEKIKKGDLLFSISQSGKQLSLYSPISGIIKKQNEALNGHSSYLNSSPYEEGWVYRIEPTNWFQEIQLMDRTEKHKKWISTEFSRVKDFLASIVNPNSLQFSHIVLQDGGLLKDGILSDFGPEVWEDFQSNFLDNYK